MSLSIDPKHGVKLKTIRKHGLGFATFLIVVEAVFSFFLYISIAQRVFVIQPAHATPGVPELISYQGLLTDTSGNPLGGAGTVYCFRYSIWDDATGGTTSTDQLWPTPALGDASTTPSNSTTTVIDGVFSDQIGRTDSLAELDFESTSTYYLQVQVSTSSLTCATGLETLSPRQQIVSNAWAQTAQGVYGSQLRTFPASNITQIGTGGGVTAGSQTLLSLDVVNTGESIGGSCSTNGTLWYDSNLKRALVCENMLIEPISNSSTTIAGFGTNGTSTIISSGNVILSAGANITLSQNGNTITIQGAAGGGGGATLSYYQNISPVTLNSTITAASGSSIWVAPFVLPQAISASYIQMPVSLSNASATAGSWASSSVATSFSGARYETDAVVIYTQGVGASSMSLQSYTSSSAGWTMQTNFSQTAGGTAYSVTYNLTYPITGGTSNYSTTTTGNVNGSVYSVISTFTNFTGLRRIDIPFAGSLSAGNYWIGLGRSTTNAFNGPSTLSSASLGMSFIGASQVTGTYGNFGIVTSASLQILPGLGYWTTNSFELSTASIALTNISAVASNPTPFFEIIRSN